MLSPWKIIPLQNYFKQERIYPRTSLNILFRVQQYQLHPVLICKLFSGLDVSDMILIHIRAASMSAYVNLKKGKDYTYKHPKSKTR